MHSRMKNSSWNCRKNMSMIGMDIQMQKQNLYGNIHKRRRSSMAAGTDFFSLVNPAALNEKYVWNGSLLICFLG